jgi:hypothetical protein
MTAKTKSKKSKTSKIKSIRPAVIEQEPKPIDEHGYPVHRFEICFQCKEKFCLTFSFAQQNYSHKHFWYYWTEKEENKLQFICSICLRSLYIERRKEFLEEIKNPQKRNNFRSLISYQLI